MAEPKTPIDYAAPSLPVPRKSCLAITITGIVLWVVSWPFLRRLNSGHQGTLLDHLESVLFLGPIMFAVGGIMLLFGLFRFVASFRRVQQILTPSVGRWLLIVWRVFIWLTVPFTVWPYWWLDILTRYQGKRPGNEGEGMAGFLMMLFIGWPSLAVAIFTETWIHRNRRKGG